MWQEETLWEFHVFSLQNKDLYCYCYYWSSYLKKINSGKEETFKLKDSADTKPVLFKICEAVSNLSSVRLWVRGLELWKAVHDQQEKMGGDMAINAALFYMETDTF